MESYDVVIVGARCAGSSLAIFLAKKGFSVCLIDKSSFPSDTLSTHIFNDWRMYKKLGIVDQLKASGSPEIKRTRIDINGSIIEGPILMTSSVFSLRRIKFDNILIEQTKKYKNIEWKPNCKLLKINYDNQDKVSGITVNNNGNSFDINCKVLVGADGRHSTVAKLTQAKKYNIIESPRCLFYAYIKNVLPITSPTFEFYWANKDIVLLYPCDANMHCLVIMPYESDYKSWVKEPRGKLESKLRSMTTLAPRLKNAVIEGNIRGTNLLDSYLRQPYGDGWVLVGDAGGAVHPCSGTGIDQAIICSDFLSECLQDYLNNTNDWEKSMSYFEQNRDPYISTNIEEAIHLAKLPQIEPQLNNWINLLTNSPVLTHKFLNNLPEFLSDFLKEDTIKYLSDLN